MNSRSKKREVLKNETIAILGYLFRAGQSLNLKDNGSRSSSDNRSNFRKTGTGLLTMAGSPALTCLK